MKSRYLSVCVCFLYTCVRKCPSSCLLTLTLPLACIEKRQRAALLDFVREPNSVVLGVYSYVTTFLQWEVALDLCCPFLLYQRIVRLFRAGYANKKSSGTGITLFSGNISRDKWASQVFLCKKEEFTNVYNFRHDF